MVDLGILIAIEQICDDQRPAFSLRLVALVLSTPIFVLGQAAIHTALVVRGKYPGGDCWTRPSGFKMRGKIR